MSNEMELVVSTDGSALDNPNGPMGWAWADHTGGDADAGGASNGTNQIGELCAVLQALRAHRGSRPLVIESDSQYAINCSSKWVQSWKRKGWKNSQGKPVKNRQLIMAIDEEIRQREGSVRFVWIKGHAGDRFNEKVDTLARGYATDARDGSRQGSLPIEGWQSLLDSDYAEGLDVPGPVRQELDGGPTVLDDQGRRRDRMIPSEQASLVEDADESSAVDTAEAADVTRMTETTENETHDQVDAEGTDQAYGIDQDQEAVPEGQAEPTTDPEDKAPDTPRTNSQARGLQATGKIRITPPPSGSARFAGNALHISGRIELDADIAPDGTVIINQAPFRLHTIETRD